MGVRSWRAVAAVIGIAVAIGATACTTKAKPIIPTPVVSQSSSNPAAPTLAPTPTVARGERVRLGQRLAVRPGSAGRLLAAAATGHPRAHSRLRDPRAGQLSESRAGAAVGPHRPSDLHVRHGARCSNRGTHRHTFGVRREADGYPEAHGYREADGYREAICTASHASPTPVPLVQVSYITYVDASTAAGRVQTTIEADAASADVSNVSVSGKAAVVLIGPTFSELVMSDLARTIVVELSPTLVTADKAPAALEAIAAAMLKFGTAPVASASPSAGGSA